MIWKILGGLFLIKYGVTLFQFLWSLLRLYVLPSFGMKIDLKKYGSWAVVTGATDGIGKEMTKELAKRGLNIVLISRSQEKLNSVAKELEPYKIEVKTLVHDFNDTSNYDIIKKGLEDLDIGILVNNVGVSYDHPDYFLEVSDEFFQRMVNVNITSINKMTRIVLADMVKRKRGLIVHLSSAAGLFPIPLLTVYSASKAFVTYFGKALHYEYASQGIDNQVITPLFVATKMSAMRAKGVMIPSAERYAKSAVDAFGLSSCMAGWWAHELQAFVQSSLPYSTMMSNILTTMQSGRKRWLRKQEQKKE